MEYYVFFLCALMEKYILYLCQVHESGELSLKHILNGHTKPVLVVAWSPDSQQLLTCGVEEVVRRWDVTSGECLCVYEKNLPWYDVLQLVLRRKACFFYGNGQEHLPVGSGWKRSGVFEAPVYNEDLRNGCVERWLNCYEHG